MEETKDNDKRAKKESAVKEKSSPGLSGELEALISTYTQSVDRVQTEKAAAVEKAQAEYRQTTQKLAAQSLHAWIDSYTAYLHAYRNLPVQPDAAASETLRSAWAGHADASFHAPETIAAWNAAWQTYRDALNSIDNSANETLAAAGGRYSEGVRSALSAHGLAELDPAAIQFVTQQIVAVNAATTQAA